MRKLAGLFVVLAVIVAGCAGGSSTAPTTSTQTSTGTLTLVIPNRESSVQRAPRFISPSANSAVIAVAGLANTTVDLSPTSSRCTNGASGRTCTAPVTAPVGTPSITVTLYDGPNGTGNILGSGTANATVAAGQAFSVNLTINGAVASIVVSVSGTFTSGQASTGSVSVTAKDAGGNTITGTYAQPVTLTNSDASGAFTFTATPNIGGTGSSVGIAYSGKVLTAPVTIGATSGSSPASVTPAVINVCSGPCPTSTPSAVPTSSTTPSPSPSPTSTSSSSPASCSATAPPLPGTFTTIFAYGAASGSTFTAASGAANASWFKATYSATSAPSGTPSGAPSPSPSPTSSPQPVFIYFGTYTLASGTNGCFFLTTSQDGSPLTFLNGSPQSGSSGFGSGSVLFGGPVTITNPSSGTLSSLTINNLGASGGSGSVSLSNGDSGTITLTGRFSSALDKARKALSHNAR